MVRRFRVAFVLGSALLALAIAPGAEAKSARLKRFVVIGDSILAGYGSGGFVESGATGQVFSAPAVLARRARVRLSQPLMDRPGVPPPYRIEDENKNGVLDPGE